MHYYIMNINIYQQNEALHSIRIMSNNLLNQNITYLIKKCYSQNRFNENFTHVTQILATFCRIPNVIKANTDTPHRRANKPSIIHYMHNTRGGPNDRFDPPVPESTARNVHISAPVCVMCFTRVGHGAINGAHSHI